MMVFCKLKSILSGSLRNALCLQCTKMQRKKESRSLMLLSTLLYFAAAQNFAFPMNLLDYSLFYWGAFSLLFILHNQSKLSQK